MLTGTRTGSKAGTKNMMGPEIRWNQDRDQGLGPGLFWDRDWDRDREHFRDRDHDKNL